MLFVKYGAIVYGSPSGAHRNLQMIELDQEAANTLAICFSPESAVIIGASTNPMKFGGRALKYCLERGYRGRLYPVNARNDIVQGMPAWSSVADLPESPDIAVIAVPASQVRESLIAAGKKGVKVAVIYGAQFAEAGPEGATRQEELLAIAQQHGMRLIGPNCMGVMSLTSGFIASFTTAPEHHDGHGWPDIGTLSVASQSGAVGIQMFAQLRDRGIGMANWISTGNQADIDVADAIAYFAADDATKSIAVYMEDASRGLKLVQALERARIARKPVVVLKVGTTPLGGVAAAGHTASLYVEDRVVGDLFAQYGVLRAGSINELIDLAAACNTGILPASNRVTAVSVSGGGAVMISDAAERGGLELPEHPEGATDALKEVNPFVNDRNPIDISAPSMSNMAITGGHLKWGLKQGQATMLGYISHVPMVPRTRAGIMPRLLELSGNHHDQLIALAGNFHEEDLKALVSSGIAVFDDPTSATEAVAKLVNAGKCLGRDPVKPETSRPIRLQARVVLEYAGIAMARDIAVASREDALAAQAAHGEIVLKLSARSLHHRTELGGVIAGLKTKAEVNNAYDDLVARIAANKADHPGLEIVAQKMFHGVEMLVGVRRDPYFGPMILLKSGGTMCELLDDITYRKTPVTRRDIEEMIDSVKFARMLDGWRGAPPVNRESLVDVLARLALVAAELPSLEINPLIVTTGGSVGVDLVTGGEQ